MQRIVLSRLCVCVCVYIYIYIYICICMYIYVVSFDMQDPSLVGTVTIKQEEAEDSAGD